MTDSHSTLDDEVDDEPIEDSRETCWFWEPAKGRCHYEPVVTGYGGPCADCPDQDAAVEPLAAEDAPTAQGCPRPWGTAAINPDEV